MIHSRKGSIIADYYVTFDSKTLDVSRRQIKSSVIPKLNGTSIANFPVNFDKTKDIMENLTTENAGKIKCILSVFIMCVLFLPIYFFSGSVS